MRSSHVLDRMAVTFDDEHAVAAAGLVLPATLASRLGIEALADELIELGDQPGAHRPGRKVMTLIHSLVVGGDCIDDADVLRVGSTGSVLGHRVMAPSTLGTFLRSFTFGHVRQLDQLAEAVLTRAWAAGAGPGDGPMTFDLDSTITEVHGDQKQGASYGYTRQLGYHPLLATRADTGEVLHIRMRKGSAGSGRGAERFVNELVARVRRAGAFGPLTMRADSAFYSGKVIKACRRHGVAFSITVNQNKAVRAAIEQIPEKDWIPIEYPDGGLADVAETEYQEMRLVVRRTRLVGPQAKLWPDWRHHAFVTNRVGTTVELDVDHRRHAVVELAIRDLKEGAGLCHCPSGKFFANSAWAVIATLAHNLLRWTANLGLRHDGPIVAKTIRRRYLTLPGRLTRSARRQTLHLPARWPWQRAIDDALGRLRQLPLTA
jgi:DDE family transposase